MSSVTDSNSVITNEGLALAFVEALNKAKETEDESLGGEDDEIIEDGGEEEA